MESVFIEGNRRCRGKEVCKWTSRLASFPNREKYQGVIIYQENTFSCLVVIKKSVTMSLVTH